MLLPNRRQHLQFERLLRFFSVATAPGSRARPRKELPRVRIDHELPVEDRWCVGCDLEMTLIRTEVSELLRLKPTHFEVEEHHRFLYGCQKCKEG